MQEREEEQGQAEPVGYDEKFCLFPLSAVKGSLWMLFGEWAGEGENGNRPAGRWME